MTSSPREPRLLPKSALIRTSSIDHPDWNYRPFLRWLQRLRFGMARELLGDTVYPRLLEVGFGSGVLMPELMGHCKQLHGIDQHPSVDAVRANLTLNGTTAELIRGSADKMPYESNSFDCAVAVSSMEFITNVEAACAEIFRVLKPNAVFVVVTPGDTPLWDLALRLATRETPAIYGDRRRRLRPALNAHFRVDREIRIPRIGGKLTRLYTGLLLKPAV